MRCPEFGESDDDATADTNGTEEGGKAGDDVQVEASDCFGAVSRGTKRDIERVNEGTNEFSPGKAFQRPFRFVHS
jgi:hypothetical protein